MKPSIHSTLFLSIFFIAMLSTSSCIKGDVIDKIIPGDTVRVNAKLPYNNIVAFSVPISDQDSLLGSVRNDTIYVYWPSYIALPDSVAPQIQLPSNATVSPASGKKIKLTGDTTYTVTAENGNRASYKLKLVVNQAIPAFSFQANATGYRLGSGFVIDASFFIPDPALTKFYLIDKNNMEIPVAGVSGLKVTGATVTIPADIDTGLYKLKVTAAWRSYTNPNAINITYPAPVINWSRVGVSVHRGDTLQVSGANLRGITAFRLLSVTDGKYYPVEIVSYALDGIIIRIPVDFPLDSWRGFQGDSPIATNGVFTKTITSSNQRITVVE